MGVIPYVFLSFSILREGGLLCMEYCLENCRDMYYMDYYDNVY